MDFQNSPPFEKSACFYVTMAGNFERFQCFNFETNFLEKENFFQKMEYRFLVETTKIENRHFHPKQLCQKPMLRQIERRVLPVTALFFWKIFFSFSTS